MKDPKNLFNIKLSQILLLRVRILRSIGERQRWKIQLHQLQLERSTVSASQLNASGPGEEP
jgi:hypothetical protein